MPVRPLLPAFRRRFHDGCVPVVWAGTNDAAAAAAAAGKLGAACWRPRHGTATCSAPWRRRQLVTGMARKPVVIADTQETTRRRGRPGRHQGGWCVRCSNAGPKRAATGLIVDAAAAQAAHELVSAKRSTSRSAVRASR